VLKSDTILKRYEQNPILTYKDVPYNAALTFNAGVAKYNGKYVMVFRNDYGDFNAQRLDGTNIGVAFSDDGIKWEVRNRPCFIMKDEDIKRAYDPRLTVIDGKCYMCFAIDTQHGICGGIAVTEDFEKFDILSVSVPDNRNMVLFPERINDRFIRLERPFSYNSKGLDMWISRSPDLHYWGDSKLLLDVARVSYATDKIGPAAPPIKTNKGWLTLFHAVDIDESRGKNGWEPTWKKRYTAGIMLLDLNDPYKIVGMCEEPLIVPDAIYEKDGGYRNNVIFPGGMILEESGEVKIYYGAADTVECLATADVNDLIRLCL
jgi:beta-1,4-mannooligosaccharide/beta-1,4-mannosyl-N-acetylglucosamine phosphorylase